MEKNRKYDTLTKNAIVDEILDQVRKKHTGPTATADRAKVSRADALLQELQQERAAKKAPAAVHTAPADQPPAAGTKEEGQSPKPVMQAVAEKVALREQETALLPKAAAFFGGGEDKLQETIHHDIVPRKVQKREITDTEQIRIQKMASFFKESETPDELVPDIAAEMPRQERVTGPDLGKKAAAGPALEKKGLFGRVKKSAEKSHQQVIDETRRQAQQSELTPAERGAAPKETARAESGESVRGATAPAAPAPATDQAPAARATEPVGGGQPAQPEAATSEMAAAERPPVAGPHQQKGAVPINFFATDEMLIRADDKPVSQLVADEASGTFEMGRRLEEKIEPLVEETMHLGDRELLKRARASKVKNFQIDRQQIEGEFEPGIGPDEAFTEQDEPDLYTDADDEEDVYQADDEHAALERLISLKGKLRMRISVTGILTLLLLYHNLAPILPLPLPGFLSPVDAPFVYLGLGLVLLLGGVLCCTSTVIGGLGYTFTLKGDNDSPVGLCFLGCLLQYVVLFFNADQMAKSGVFLYSAVAMMALFCNCMGKLNMVCRILRNYKFITSDIEKYTCELVEPASLAENIVKGVAIRDPQVAYRRPCRELSGFISHSFSEDFSDKCARVLGVLGAVVALLVGCFLFITRGDVVAVSSTVALILCAVCPFSLMLCFNIPFSRICKYLNRFGGVLSGYSAVEKLQDLNAVVVSDADLFPRGSVLLHGIKTFGGERIDEAILKTASVVCSKDSAISSVFLKVIENRTDILLSFDSYVYENGMGYSCWIDNKRILVGNRELMLNHGVDVPSADYEKKYRRDGTRELLYLATSGELTAMFVLSYNQNPQVAEMLQKLDPTGLLLAVKTKDPNLTAQRVAQVYDLPEDMFTVIHSHTAAQLEEKPADLPGDCALCTMGSFISFAQGILSAFHAKSQVTASVVIQSVGAGIALLLAVLFSMVFGQGLISTSVLFLYQMVWLVLSIGLPCAKRL